MSAYLLSSPGFNLTNVTSSVVTQLHSVSSIFSEIRDVCLDQVVAGCHRGYDIWYNRLTKLLRGEVRGGEVRAQVD